MILERNSFYTGSFCEKICQEDSNYDPSEGIIIELVPRMLTLRSPNYDPNLNLNPKGLRLTHNPSHSQLPRPKDHPRFKSTFSLQPKTKLSIKNVERENSMTKLNIENYETCVQNSILNPVSSLGGSQCIGTGDRSKNKLLPVEDAHISSKMEQADEVTVTKGCRTGIKIHRLSREENQQGHNNFLQLVSAVKTSSVPSSPCKKRTFIRLQQRKKGNPRKTSTGIRVM